MGSKHVAVAGEITVAPGPWSETLLVCGKCSRKLKGGFGPNGRQKLAACLKQQLREFRLRRTVRVIQVDCLDICPKHGVVVIKGSTPGEMLIVPRHLPETEVTARLLGPRLTEQSRTGS